MNARFFTQWPLKPTNEGNAWTYPWINLAIWLGLAAVAGWLLLRR